jgi:carboxypeptidase T
LPEKYVQLVNTNFNKEHFLPSDEVELSPEFKNKGLAAAHNLVFSLTSPSQHITINSGTASLNILDARSSYTLTTPFSFSISTAAPVDEEIPIILTTTVDGNLISSDTTIVIIGFPVFIFEDNSNNPTTYWTITKSPASSPQWDSTYKSFYSAPVSYTDSKNGNYINNATVTMTLTNPLNLTGYTSPRLTFQTKFDIENDFDYGQVKVSTNNGSTWIPLIGRHTQPGVSPQPVGQPLYDGVISSWVKEEMSLANYISSELKIQFQLKTDGGTRKDGWYLDDIGVFIYTIPTDIQLMRNLFINFLLSRTIRIRLILARISNFGFRPPQAEDL